MARVYVGTWKKYNAGSIGGQWIDLEKCSNYSDFLKKCASAHNGEADPEYMIQDTEDLPDGLQSVGDWMSEQEFNDIKEAIQEESKGEQTATPDVRIVDYSANSFAVVGDTKPVKDDLKKMGGRWNSRLSCGTGWIFSKKNLELVKAFISSGVVATENVCNGKKAPIIGPKINQDLVDEYMAECQKIWPGDKKMMDLCRKELGDVIRLESGCLVKYEKPTIETSFCFGYGYFGAYDDHKDAIKQADNASKNQDYFLNENLKSLDEEIKKVESIKDTEEDKYGLYFRRASYYSVPAGSLNFGDVMILSHYLSDYELDRLRMKREDLQPLTATDRANYLEMLRRVREAFSKRLHSYLKRYGMSKIHSWSYWADA